jgi:hypothetical protein
MSLLRKGTITADGSVVIPLKNIRGVRNVYTVHLYNSFGGGTLTAYTNPTGATSAAAGTGADVQITDSAGSPISKTSAASFNFECNSDSVNPTVLKLKLAGSSSPALNYTVNSAG